MTHKNNRERRKKEKIKSCPNLLWKNVKIFNIRHGRKRVYAEKIENIFWKTYSRR
jgi:hypothetical protein